MIPFDPAVAKPRIALAVGRVATSFARPKLFSGEMSVNKSPRRLARHECPLDSPAAIPHVDGLNMRGPGAGTSRSDDLQKPKHKSQRYGPDPVAVLLYLHKSSRLFHHDLPRHLRMDAAVIGIRPCLGKRVGEAFVRVHHLGLEQEICTDGGMRNIVVVRPSHGSAGRYRNRLRTKAEILNLYLRVCCRARVTRRGTA
jgi:hypothetical protein